MKKYKKKIDWWEFAQNQVFACFGATVFVLCLLSFHSKVMAMMGYPLW